MKNKLKLFEKECRRLADLWELNNWTFLFSLMPKEDTMKWQGGAITRTFDNCQAEIQLDENFCKNIDILKETAKHEMIHCLIGKLYYLGKSRNFNISEYDREEEELVHKLEKIIK